MQINFQDSEKPIHPVQAGSKNDIITFEINRNSMSTIKKDFLINHDSPIPLHAQAESLLRKMVELPEYKIQGKLLPKEVDLANLWGISRNTLRQAINKLLMEGILERKTGVGTKVITKRITTNLDNWLSFTQEMSQKDIPMTNFFAEANWVNASKNVADAFGIEEGKTILQLRRLRGLEKTPVVYFESYIHPRIEIDPNEDFHTSLYDLLENKYHIIPAISKEEIKAEKADKALSQILQIEENEPVLERIRLVLDIGKKPVEYCYAYYRYDLFTYSIDIKRNL